MTLSLCLRIAMLAYVCIHSGPEVLRRIREAHERCLGVPWYKKTYIGVSCAVISAILFTPALYYGGLHES